jgi:hypothetical protein
MTIISLETIPKSFQKIFGNPPKDPQIFEFWINNVWNVWLTNVSEQDKFKYRKLDKKNSKYNKNV